MPRDRRPKPLPLRKRRRRDSSKPNSKPKPRRKSIKMPRIRLRTTESKRFKMTFSSRILRSNTMLPMMPLRRKESRENTKPLKQELMPLTLKWLRNKPSSTKSTRKSRELLKKPENKKSKS
jgi:hypothetical protein